MQVWAGLSKSSVHAQVLVNELASILRYCTCGVIASTKKLKKIKVKNNKRIDLLI